LERATPDELAELLQHALQKAGAVKLMTPELIATLADHAQGNAPMPFPELRERCRVRAATLYQRLAALSAADRIVKTDTGYRLAGG
jgi:hypothetical protein